MVDSICRPFIMVKLQEQIFDIGNPIEEFRKKSPSLIHLPGWIRRGSKPGCCLFLFVYSSWKLTDKNPGKIGKRNPKKRKRLAVRTRRVKKRPAICRRIRNQLLLIYFHMAGVRGFEPRKWQIQSLLPYRLAIPQCDHARLIYSRSESKSSISLRNLFDFGFELFCSTRTPILKHFSVLNATLNLIFFIFSTGYPCPMSYQK